ncbi:unnamed protein product [Prorocentrum cordatum]|uniref:Uncharacterized protein n=1 Tax=Prorocentrum cordatum TaxID=2364126 RepID=A0ABN9THG4_9DINO|nr:unnamed protein product [Polarella glacialis]
METWSLKGGVQEGALAAKKVAAGVEELLAQIIKLVAALTLKNSLEIRELQAAAFIMIFCQTDIKYISEAWRTSKQYADTCKAAAEGRGQKPLGEPHVHVWANLTALAATDDHLSPEERTVVTNHRSAASDPDALVHVCKVRRAFRDTNKKLFLATAQEAKELTRIMVKAISASGGVQKYGQAPRAGGERKLQVLLDELRKIVPDAPCKGSMEEL